jgi:hypothetical protein
LLSARQSYSLTEAVPLPNCAVLEESGPPAATRKPAAIRSCLPGSFREHAAGGAGSGVTRAQQGRGGLAGAGRPVVDERERLSEWPPLCGIEHLGDRPTQVNGLRRTTTRGATAGCPCRAPNSSASAGAHFSASDPDCLCDGWHPPVRQPIRPVARLRVRSTTLRNRPTTVGRQRPLPAGRGNADSTCRTVRRDLTAVLPSDA